MRAFTPECHIHQPFVLIEYAYSKGKQVCKKTTQMYNITG